MKSEFTIKEKRIRKNWLVSFVIQFLVWSILFFLGCFGTGQALMETSFLGLIAITLSSLLIVGLPGMLLFWLFFHCALKKPGTKLLIFQLIMIPWNILKIGRMIDFFPSYLTIGIQVDVIFLVWWWISCLLLLTLNRKWKKNGDFPCADLSHK